MLSGQPDIWRMISIIVKEQSVNHSLALKSMQESRTEIVYVAYMKKTGIRRRLAAKFLEMLFPPPPPEGRILHRSELKLFSHTFSPNTSHRESR